MENQNNSNPNPNHVEVDMELAKKFKITDQRLVVFRTLKDGPRTWKDLKAAYYGDSGRNNSKSHNSFAQQLTKLEGKGVIAKADGHYELTEFGQAILSIVDDTKMEAAKTQAQQNYEASKASTQEGN